MNPRTKILVILVTSLLAASAARAMEIRQFDKMADSDQSEYIGNLIVGAENALIDEGKPDLAAQIKNLFTTKEPGDADVIGMVEFERNLALARVADTQRAERDPNAHRLEVEDAMLVTLQKNNIPLSQGFVKAFRAINAGFRTKNGPIVAPTPVLRAAPPATSHPKPDDDDPIGPGGFITPPPK